MHKHKSRNALFACLFTSVFLFPFFISSEEPDTISGMWKLNEKESEDAREKIESTMRDKMGSARGPGGGMSRPGGFGGGRGAEMRGGMKDLMEPPQQITISYNNPEIKISDQEGKEQNFYTDGRKTDRTVGEDRTISFTSKWEDDSLIVESQGPNGGKITQTYYLSSTGKQLYVKTRMKPMMMDDAITITRVYDFVPPENTNISQ